MPVLAPGTPQELVLDLRLHPFGQWLAWVRERAFQWARRPRSAREWGLLLEERLWETALPWAGRRKPQVGRGRLVAPASPRSRVRRPAATCLPGRARVPGAGDAFVTPVTGQQFARAHSIESEVASPKGSRARPRVSLLVTIVLISLSGGYEGISSTKGYICVP